MMRRSPYEAANSSDYEKISSATPDVGKIAMKKLCFSNRQLVRSQHKTMRSRGVLLDATKRIVMLVTNRDEKIPIYYVMLRMDSRTFWISIVCVQLLLAAVCAFSFFLIGQPLGKAVLLALDVNGLTVGDVECEGGHYDGSNFGAVALCRSWAAVLNLLHAVFVLFIGGVIVVRLSKAVAKHRFEFSQSAVIVDKKELCIRFVSAKPSMVVMPTFRLEYFDEKGRARPLELVNGGTIAYLHDTSLYLRHSIDASSPFSQPNWRCHVIKLRVAVMGFDELIAQDVCGVQIYMNRDILDDAMYDDVMFRGRIQMPHEDQPRLILYSDMSKLDQLIYLEQDNDDATKAKTVTQAQTDEAKDEPENPHQLTQLTALDEENIIALVKPATSSTLDNRPGLGKRAASLFGGELNEYPRGEFPLPKKKRRPWAAHNKEVDVERGLGGRTFSQLQNVRHVPELSQGGGVIRLRDVKYSDRAMLEWLVKSDTSAPHMVLCVTNRRHGVPIPWMFLRMKAKHFWLSVVLIAAGVAFFGAVVFVIIGGQPVVDAVLLSLAAHNMAVGDVECRADTFSGSGWLMCRVVAVVVRLNFWLFELFFGAMIIVRLSRIVVQNRFKFSNFCVLTRQRKELVVRIVSNRPSQIVMPTFVLEYMDSEGKRLHPLELTNGGSTAYLGDSTFFLRHSVTKDSPFADPNWRSKVLGVRVAVMGYDDLLATEACGCRYYLNSQICDTHDFGDIVSIGTIRYRRHDHKAYLVDMSKVNDKKVRIERPPTIISPRLVPGTPVGTEEEKDLQLQEDELVAEIAGTAIPEEDEDDDVLDDDFEELEVHDAHDLSTLTSDIILSYHTLSDDDDMTPNDGDILPVDVSRSVSEGL